ncbi:MAG: AtzG-like protein [Pseudomonadota bacterium]
MNDDDILHYVKAAAAAMDMPLDEVAAKRVAVQLARTAVLARSLDGAAMGVHDEPAEIFRAAPFPVGGPPQ